MGALILTHGSEYPFHSTPWSVRIRRSRSFCHHSPARLSVRLRVVHTKFGDRVKRYALALRSRLDSSGLAHVRIIVPDGNINDILHPLQANASYLAATWGLGQHYPGAGGTSADERALGKPLWSSEDYSTYSDATGAGCFARLLVQNVGWGYSATISWCVYPTLFSLNSSLFHYLGVCTHFPQAHHLC